MLQLYSAAPVTGIHAFPVKLCIHDFTDVVQVVMRDPVIAADGHTYERTAMEIWLQQHQTSPVSGKELKHSRLIPNLAAKSAIGTQQRFH